MPIRRFQSLRHQLPRESISWIGQGLETSSRFFGAFEGSFYDVKKAVNGKSWTTPFYRDGLDAVNGAATLGEFLAVTSRSEIRLFGRDKPVRADDRSGLGKFLFGGHGVTAIQGLSTFLVSLGSHGLARIVPVRKQVVAHLFDSFSIGINFYKAARVGVVADGELVATACRKSGVGVLVLNKERLREFSRLRPFGGLDIIDIHPLRTPRLPRALLALSRDGTICFTPDILNSNKVTAIKPTVPMSEAYGMVVSDGHGFILTDSRLVCIPEIVDDMIKNNRSTRACYAIATDASDILPTGPGQFAILEKGKAVEFNASEFVRTIFASDSEKSIDRREGKYTEGYIEEGDLDETKESWEEFNPFNMTSEESESIAFA